MIGVQMTRENPPLPPMDIDVSQSGQLIMTIASAILTATFWLIALRMSVRERSIYPVLMMVGGVLCLPLEAVFDYNFHVWYYDTGSTWYPYSTYGVVQPYWLVLTYTWCYGGLALLVCAKLRNGGTRADVLRTGLLAAAMYTTVELCGINLGTYTYYGPHAFTVFNFPVWMTFFNVAVSVTAGIAAAAAMRRLPPDRPWALVVVGPAAFGAIQFMAFPELVVINTDNPPQWLVLLGALASLVALFVTMRLVLQLVPARSDPVVATGHQAPSSPAVTSSKIP